MSAPPEQVVTEPASPLIAFTGPITRTKTKPIYKGALAIVAFAMVLLPLIYIGLIAFTAWIVVFHLKKDTWILEGTSGHGALYGLILYLGPGVAGAILVFFMVKPFFATKGKVPEPLALDPGEEPLLFAFV